MNDNALPVTSQVTANIVFKNKFVELRDDEVQTPGGELRKQIVFTSGSGTNPFTAVIARGKIALTFEERYTRGGYRWGVPLGFAWTGDLEADARGVIARKLGIEAPELVELGTYEPDTGILANADQLFAAPLDTTPELTAGAGIAAARWFDLAAVFVAIRQGVLRDGYTHSALVQLMAHGLIPIGSARTAEWEVRRAQADIEAMFAV